MITALSVPDERFCSDMSGLRSLDLRVDDIVRPAVEANHCLPSPVPLAVAELKVLDPVVVALAVDVVDRLRAQEWAAKRFLHDVAVLRHVAIGHSARRAFGHPHLDIPVCPSNASTLPRRAPCFV